MAKRKTSAERKSKGFFIRVSIEEKKDITKRAAKAGLSAATFVRVMALRGTLPAQTVEGG